ncbi:hypothetical protein M5K25_019263 [Dendrobium thyrsiflorum]|uniref:Uncharacterized protein n=1 Tax=Dendrobium thyrsiflorum TaxID=117978 RepID=A0ABD0UEI3_DENTH
MVEALTQGKARLGVRSANGREEVSGVQSYALRQPEGGTGKGLRSARLKGSCGCLVSHVAEICFVWDLETRRMELDIFDVSVVMTHSVSRPEVIWLSPRSIFLAMYRGQHRVFTHRSYYVSNYFMKLIKWSPFLDILEESPIILVLISFPDLCPQFFFPRILHGLGSLFGRLIQMVNATTVSSRVSVATTGKQLIFGGIFGKNKFDRNSDEFSGGFPTDFF